MTHLDDLRAELRAAELELPNVGPLGRRDQLELIDGLHRAIRREAAAPITTDARDAVARITTDHIERS